MISGFGGGTLDTIHQISHWPDADNTSYIQKSRTAAGGMTLGALIAAARLGAPVSFSGALGDDKEGRQLIDAMARNNIASSNCNILKGRQTPVSQVMIDPEGRRTIFHNRGLRNCDFHQELDTIKLESTELLLLDGSWIENTVHWAEAASEKSIPIVLDLSPNNLHRLRDDLIKISDYPVLTEVLAAKISGTENNEEQTELLHKRFGGTIIITAGSRGVFWAEYDKKIHHLPAFQVKTVDTCGAGDIFHGAFAVAIHEGQKLNNAIRFAMGTAALKCTGMGQENLPDRNTLQNFLDQVS
jgi:sulfofructose kinase